MDKSDSKSSQELAEERTEIAHERTDFAEDRTLLANERTFAGWGRTAFAAIGLGLGFQAVFKTTEPTYIAKSIASLFVLLGVILIWLAERRANRVLNRCNEHKVELSSNRTFLLMAMAVSVGGLALVACFWFLI